MKIIFIDETDRQASSTNRTFFCICGLVVDGNRLIEITNRLEEIKAKYNLPNLKDCRTTGMDEEARLAITSEMFECLNSGGIKVIGIVLGDFSLSFNLPKADMYMGAMSFLIERFTLPLIRDSEAGIVIFDGMEKSLENELRKKFYDYTRTEVIQMAWKSQPEGAVRDHVLPTLFFTDDAQSLLIQAIDLVAVSLNSAIANQQKNGGKIVIKDLPENNKFLKIYWPLFVQSPKGEVEGWGIKIWD